MSNSVEPDEAGGYLRLALPMMTKQEIPPTPRNYTVWYNHVAGYNQALSDEIERLIETGNPFTEEVNEGLYWEFCANNDEHELRNLRQDLQRMLLTIIDEAATFSGQTEEYGNSISNTVTKLSADVSVKEIRSVVNEVIEKTRDITSAGQATTLIMQDATGELENLQKAFAEAKAETLLDFLTGIPNRKAFNEKLMTLASQVTLEKPLCLLMIDIDHFKRFNDQHGHMIGDEVLKFVSRQIKNVIRGWDFLARYGGEEFTVLLPDTSLQGAVSVATNIQRYFSEAKLKTGKTAKPLGKITVSIGISLYQANETVDSFITRADQALYLSKHSGRNTVSTELDLS